MQHILPTSPILIQIDPKQRAPRHIARCQHALRAINDIAPAAVPQAPRTRIYKREFRAAVVARGVQDGEEGRQRVAGVWGGAGRRREVVVVVLVLLAGLVGGELDVDVGGGEVALEVCGAGGEARDTGV